MSVRARAGRQCDHEGEEVGCPECRKFFADIVSDEKEAVIDTANRFAVGATADRIVFTLTHRGPTWTGCATPLRISLTPAEALNLAAWLAVIADRRIDAGYNFNTIRDAIERS